MINAPLSALPENIARDVETVGQIPIVQKLLEVVCHATGMGFAAIARVTDDRWVTCSVRDEIAFGLQPGDELVLETTICNEIRQHHRPVVVDDVSVDPVFCSHHTPAQYGFQSYISYPIFRLDGSFFGTLCAIDPDPARLSRTAITGMFVLFTDLITQHLGVMEGQRRSEQLLAEERRAAELREQFIAVLGHDLRNPLGAVVSSAEVIAQITSDPEVEEMLGVIRRSSRRMEGLITNLMDLAQGRLGGGVKLQLRQDAPLRKHLEHVIAEMRTQYPERAIDARFTLNAAVECDPLRVAQLFSNLLANALTHGAAETPVEVGAHSDEQGFVLIVSNAGEPIPPETMERLFQPFQRGGVINARGLGLGLYIASEIARAHGGQLTCTSTNEETRFTFELPVLRQPITALT